MIWRILLIPIWVSAVALAQVNDDFSDGDFTANPVWNGDVGLFQVNASLQLQSNGNPATETIYLSTPNARVSDTEWRFYLGYNNNPSGTNNLRIYLVSDQADLTGPLNGYFLSAGGETGTDDSYDLYRQDGTTETLLIDGIDASANPTDAVVRVLRDATGNWTLSIDQGGNGIFQVQGDILDDTYASSTHMGVVVSHTATRADDFFVDDVYVGNELIDTDPPQALAVQILSATEIEVEFDEPLEVSSAETVGNYTLDQGIGAPVQAQLDGGNPIRVLLTLPTPLTDQTSYQLTVVNVTDLSGNGIATPQIVGFDYFVPETPVFRDVILNEFMPDPNPSQGLPDAEFIELYNRSNKVLDLDGWTISDASSSGTLPSFPLDPGEYVLIVSTANAALFTGFGDVISPSSLPALNNGGDDLVLKAADGTLIDSLTYSLSWYRDPEKDGGGFSLELINPEDESCPAPANWRASDTAIGGTPGGQNSIFSLEQETDRPLLLGATVQNATTVKVCFNEIMDPASLELPQAYSINQGIGTATSAEVDSTGECAIVMFANGLTPGIIYTLTVGGLKDCSGNIVAPGARSRTPVVIGLPVQPFDVVINEFMADAEPVVGLPAVDFVELYNRTERALDISNFQVSDPSSTAVWGDLVIFPGEYLIVCDEDAEAAFSGFGRVIGVPSFPSLNISSDSLWLVSPLDEVIDYVYYTDEWYDDPSRSDGGYTLERIDPDFVDCNLAGNWRASQDGSGGTPGKVNSVDGEFVDNTPPMLEEAIVLDSQTVLLRFSEPIDPANLEEESNYSLDEGIGQPQRARANGVGNQAVRLELSTPLQARTVYTLTFSGLTDCVGNSAEGAERLGITEPPAPFEIVFNELFADPSPVVGLPDEEFIELLNRTDKLLELGGLQLSDGGSPVTFGVGTIFPGEELIICAESNADQFRSFGRVIGLSRLPSLGNTTDSLTLRSATGEVLDYVFYSDEWYQDVEKAEGGWTLERIDPEFIDCSNEGNWRASNSVSGGTPGQENSILGTFVDEEPARVVAIRPTANGIEIEFDEQLDSITLADIANYQADGGLGEPLVAIPEAPHFRRVELIFLLAIDSNRVYRLQLDGLTDCAGNVLTTDAPFGLPIPPAPGDLLINEILFNPYTGGADFVEVVNASTNILDLGRIQLEEGVPGTDSTFNEDLVSEQPFILFPGDLICLTRDVLFQQLAYRPPPRARFLEMSGFPSYDDSEGECVITDTSGVIIDRFFYLDDYQYPTLEDVNGVSLERISLLVPTRERSNWHSASSIVGYATPGYENSQAAEIAEGDSEVFLDKQTFSPNLDGDDDLLAINYQFDFVGANARITVYDTRGHLVRTLQQNLLLDPAPGTFFWDGFDDNGQRLSIGMYVILFEVTDNTTGERKAYRRVAVLADRL